MSDKRAKMVPEVVPVEEAMEAMQPYRELPKPLPRLRWTSHTIGTEDEGTIIPPEEGSYKVKASHVVVGKYVSDSRLIILWELD